MTSIEYLETKINGMILNGGDLGEDYLAVLLHIQQAKEMDRLQKEVTEDTSDGYHTFKELYEFRKVYNAALFNEWAKEGKYNVHKSMKHHDGELCFGGFWFIVVAKLPNGQISNHYEIKDWYLFNCMETEKALFEFDGHTPKDVLNRINDLYKPRDYLEYVLKNYIPTDADDCYFQPKKLIAFLACITGRKHLPSMTICANCGKEKFLHKK